MEADQSTTPMALSEGASKEKDPSEYYWNSYAHFGIHEEMLKDEVRMKAYRSSIVDNKHLFRDKVVLDVGCGTGIMSLFAARTGAKRVFAVDNSEIAEQAKQIVEDNKMSDVITVIKGKVEDITLPVDQVDVIISEWMGYCLLYESMLQTVIVARDKWLKPGGVILPDKATMHLTAIEDSDYKEDKINWWERVYGFDMHAIKDMAIKEPLVDVVDNKQVMANSCCVLTVDINTVKEADLDFSSSFRLIANRDDFCHALVAYFDIEFTKCHKKIHFSTGPHAHYTHWKQTVFYLSDVLSMKKGDEIRGEFMCKPNAKNFRDLDIKINYQFDGEYDSIQNTQEFFLR